MYRRTLDATLLSVALVVAAAGCGGASTPRLVTNRHVAGGRLSAELSTWDGTDLGATISHVSSVSDLASMTGPAGDGLALALSDPRPATPVWVAGYPGGGALQLIRGTVLDYTDGRGYGEAGRLVRSDVPLMHGSSGSPVMNSSGEVVGVAFGVESDNSEALIVPASTVRRFLSASQPSTAQRNCSSG